MCVTTIIKEKEVRKLKRCDKDIKGSGGRKQSKIMYIQYSYMKLSNISPLIIV